MGAERRPKVATIPAWRGFVDDLAYGLLQLEPDPLSLAACHILLPNRRSAKALSEAFLRHADGKALLLPKISVLGDLEADELTGAFAEGLEGKANSLPSVERDARRLLVARLLGHKKRPVEALALARQLTAAVDLMLAEGKTGDDLAEAAPDALLQEHWLINREILAVAVDALPEILAERKLLDPVLRSNMLLELQAKVWASNPPPHRVILAGIAHAIPAIARLAHVVARLPKGLVLLPAFDRNLSEGAHALIRGEEDKAGLESHPMHGMVQLLDAIGVAPAEVEQWQWEAPIAGSSAERAQLISDALAPAALAPAASFDGPVDGLQMVEAENAAEEAAVIAIALRQVIEIPGKTGLLVTSDRNLARRVAVQLRRFGIDVDDSAGVPLGHSGPGSLLVALAGAAGEAFAPVALLSLLMHPLVREGEARLPWLDKVRALDKALRGIRPARGLRGVTARLASAKSGDELRGWWEDEVAPMLQPLSTHMADGHVFLRTLLSVAEALAGEALWSHEAGKQLASLMQTLDGAAKDLAALKPSAQEYQAFVALLFEGQVVRPNWRRHPQLQILGPIEARLQRADLVVLGGMNEGVWPARPAPDPFLAPLVRRRLGLPGLSRRIGMQAHDLVLALGAPEVLMTRSAREGSAPSVPSRFWARIEAATSQPLNKTNSLPDTDTLLYAARQLDRPAQPISWKRPEPAPPVDVRPRNLSVTEVARLKADPFAFYARRILQLEPLDPLDKPITAAERGTAVHEILEQLFGPGGDVDQLITAELQKMGDGPELQALWRPRLARMVADAMEHHAESTAWEIVSLEGKGKIECRGVTLVGKADRVERGEDGLRIVDYKTGGLPKVKDVKALWDTQLALLASIAEAGGFEKLAPGKVTGLFYWKLSGTQKEGEIRKGLGSKATDEDLESHKEHAWQDFEALIGRYLLSATGFKSKAHMVFGKKYSDYDQLARVAEWLGQ